MSESYEIMDETTIKGIFGWLGAGIMLFYFYEKPQHINVYSIGLASFVPVIITQLITHYTETLISMANPLPMLYGSTVIICTSMMVMVCDACVKPIEHVREEAEEEDAEEEEADEEEADEEEADEEEADEEEEQDTEEDEAYEEEEEGEATEEDEDIVISEDEGEAVDISDEEEENQISEDEGEAVDVEEPLLSSSNLVTPITPFKNEIETKSESDMEITPEPKTSKRQPMELDENIPEFQTITDRIIQELLAKQKANRSYVHTLLREFAM